MVNAKGNGYGVVIAAAGMAAALPGVCSAYTSLPVLGVPLDGGLSGGIDALYSIVQMPAGLPVGTLAVGKAGARNAAVLAARILALSDAAIAEKVEAFKQNEYRI
jgi:5-(carboxyamino)imidazole ribonucleotide mutase